MRRDKEVSSWREVDVCLRVWGLTLLKPSSFCTVTALSSLLAYSVSWWLILLKRNLVIKKQQQISELSLSFLWPFLTQSCHFVLFPRIATGATIELTTEKSKSLLIESKFVCVCVGGWVLWIISSCTDSKYLMFQLWRWNVTYVPVRSQIEHSSHIWNSRRKSNNKTSAAHHPAAASCGYIGAQKGKYRFKNIHCAWLLSEQLNIIHQVRF